MLSHYDEVAKFPIENDWLLLAIHIIYFNLQNYNFKDLKTCNINIFSRDRMWFGALNSQDIQNNDVKCQVHKSMLKICKPNVNV